MRLRAYFTTILRKHHKMSTGVSVPTTKVMYSLISQEEMICPEDVLAITLSLRVQISRAHDSKLAFIGSYSTITILYLLNIPPMHDKNTNACCVDIKVFSKSVESVVIS